MLNGRAGPWHRKFYAQKLWMRRALVGTQPAKDGSNHQSTSWCPAFVLWLWASPIFSSMFSHSLHPFTMAWQVPQTRKAFISGCQRWFHWCHWLPSWLAEGAISCVVSDQYYGTFAAQILRCEQHADSRACFGNTPFHLGFFVLLVRCQWYHYHRPFAIGGLPQQSPVTLSVFSYYLLFS